MFSKVVVYLKTTKVTPSVAKPIPQKHLASPNWSVLATEVLRLPYHLRERDREMPPPPNTECEAHPSVHRSVRLDEGTELTKPVATHTSLASR